MDEMNKWNEWIDASLSVLREGLKPDAGPDERQRAATVCLSLHAMVSPVTISPLPAAPQPAAMPPVAPEPEPDIFDVLMAKLAAFAPGDRPVAFNPQIVPTGGER